MADTYEKQVNMIKDTITKKALDDWFPGDMKAARFAVYIDKFVKVKFMDVLDKIGNVDRRVRRIGGNAKRRFDQVDDRMDEIEDKLDEILDQIRKLKE